MSPRVWVISSSAIPQGLGAISQGSGARGSFGFGFEILEPGFRVLVLSSNDLPRVWVLSPRVRVLTLRVLGAIPYGLGAISQGLAVISQGLGATQKSPGFWVTSNIPASWRTFKVLAPPELDSGVLEPPRLEGSFLEASQARLGFNFSVLEPPALGCGVLKPLRAVPRCVEERFGETQWWVLNDPPQRQRLNDKVWRKGSRIHAPKPRPEQTARSAVRRRRRRRRRRRGRRSRQIPTLAEAPWHGAAVSP